MNTLVRYQTAKADYIAENFPHEFTPHEARLLPQMPTVPGVCLRRQCQMSTDPNYDLRVERTIRFKNARLFSELQRWPTVTQFALECGVSKQDVYSLLSLQLNPYYSKRKELRGSLRPLAHTIATFLDIPPLELFPPDLYQNAGHFIPITSVMMANSVEMVALKEARNVPAIEQSDGLAFIEERRAHIAEVLHTLSPREEKIIKLRFGIDCDREHTLEEIGQEFDVTRERIRVIEAKALKTLRHVSRSHKLIEWVER